LSLAETAASDRTHATAKAKTWRKKPAIRDGLKSGRKCSHEAGAVWPRPIVSSPSGK
jgi:hypothetical protein